MPASDPALRPAVPAAHPVLDQRADVSQIGVLTLELILGRRIAPDEYPDRVGEVLERAWRSTAAQHLPAEVRAWLLRMLQLDTDQAYTSAVDGWADLETALGALDNGASIGALETVMAEYMRRGLAVSAGALAEAAS